MDDISTNRDIQTMQTSFGPHDRQRIQQGLRGVFMSPIASVQHRTVHLLGQKINRPGLGVAHDQQIGMHGI